MNVLQLSYLKIGIVISGKKLSVSDVGSSVVDGQSSAADIGIADISRVLVHYAVLEAIRAVYGLW